jgi:hypothetical protein
MQYLQTNGASGGTLPQNRAQAAAGWISARRCDKKTEISI